MILIGVMVCLAACFLMLHLSNREVSKLKRRFARAPKAIDLLAKERALGREALFEAAETIARDRKELAAVLYERVMRSNGPADGSFEALDPAAKAYHLRRVMCVVEAVNILAARRALVEGYERQIEPPELTMEEVLGRSDLDAQERGAEALFEEAKRAGRVGVTPIRHRGEKFSEVEIREMAAQAPRMVERSVPPGHECSAGMPAECEHGRKTEIFSNHIGKWFSFDEQEEMCCTGRYDSSEDGSGLQDELDLTQ